MQLPFRVQNSTIRTIYHVSCRWAVEICLRLRASFRYAPKVTWIRAEPEGRGSVARAKRRALTVTTHDKWISAYSNRAAGRRQRCSRSKTNVPDLRRADILESGRANVLSLSRSRPSRAGQTDT